MPELPIRRMILYKHGVGYFERRGAVSGTALRLSFPRAAMDDVLKSLVALDLGAGQVHGVDFETPEDRAARNLVAIVLLNQHKFDEARDIAEQILKKQPQDLMALGTESDPRPAAAARRFARAGVDLLGDDDGDPRDAAWLALDRVD